MAAEYRLLYHLDDLHWWCQGMRRITLALVDDLSPDIPLSVLDAGCGAGSLAAQLGSRHGVVGLELSSWALYLARARGVEQATQGSVEALPFADNTFDLAICLDVLYHAGVGNNQQALAELRRVLRPGGWLLVRVPAYEWLKGPHDRAMHTAKRFTARSLRQMVENAGFRAYRVTYANTLLFPFQALWRQVRRWHGNPMRSDLFRAPEWLNRALAGVLSAERLWLRWADLPFGLSVFCLARKSDAGCGRLY